MMISGFLGLRAALKNKRSSRPLGEMLLLIFPKGPQSDWGWSRTGWSWQAELAGPEGIFLELGADDSAVDSGFLIGNTHRTNGLFDRKRRNMRME